MEGEDEQVEVDGNDENADVDGDVEAGMMGDGCVGVGCVVMFDKFDDGVESISMPFASFGSTSPIDDAIDDGPSDDVSAMFVGALDGCRLAVPNAFDVALDADGGPFSSRHNSSNFTNAVG